MPEIDIGVTPDGRISITVDGQTGPALPVEAVEAAQQAIPAAQNAATRREMTAGILALTNLLAVAPSDLDATLRVTAGRVDAYVGAGVYLLIERALGAQPDSDGALHISAAVVVWPPISTPTPPDTAGGDTTDGGGTE